MLEIIAAFVLSFAGIASLNIKFNHRDAPSLGWRETPALPNWAFKISGWILLSLALTPSVLTWGLGIGLVMWFIMLTLAAGVQLKLLAHAPTMSMGIAPTSAVIGLACASLVILTA
jgi:hypothetical protein